MTGEERLQHLEATVLKLIQDVERLPATRSVAAPGSTSPREVDRLAEEAPATAEAPDVLYRPPAAGEWPVMSTLAHLEELLPYWAHQAEAISRAPGQPFGRTHQDPDRIAAVEMHGHDSLQAIVPRLRASLDECLRTLRALPANGWQVAGVHATRGSMTVEQVVEAFLCSHAQEHAAQMQATLSALRTESEAR